MTPRKPYRRTLIGRLLCGLLHHHDGMMLHYEDDRLSLHCVDCGHDSPGWELASRLKQSVPTTKVHPQSVRLVGTDIARDWDAIDRWQRQQYQPLNSGY